MKQLGRRQSRSDLCVLCALRGAELPALPLRMDSVSAPARLTRGEAQKLSWWKENLALSAAVGKARRTEAWLSAGLLTGRCERAVGAGREEVGFCARDLKWFGCTGSVLWHLGSCSSLWHYGRTRAVDGDPAFHRQLCWRERLLGKPPCPAVALWRRKDLILSFGFTLCCFIFIVAS